ncbi:MAG: DsbA family protein [Bdellovibrionota bacterium]
MKNKLITVAPLLFLLSACAPSASQLQKTFEDHPEILVKAIEKNPVAILEALGHAQELAQGAMREKAEKEAEAKREVEFKNPLKPVIDEKRSFMGPANAPVTIVEYTDFQCPYCGGGYQTIEQVKKAYGDKVRIFVKNLPLPMHPMAIPAAKRFEALKMQDPKMAWAYYNEVFSNQEQLNQEEVKFLDAVAKKVGANMAKLKKDMDSKAVADLIASDQAEAHSFGIDGTPGFIISGVSIRGNYPFETFKKVIDRKLKGE